MCSLKANRCAKVPFQGEREEEEKEGGVGGENSHEVLGYNLGSPEPPSDPQPQRTQDFQGHRKGLSRQLLIKIIQM